MRRGTQLASVGRRIGSYFLALVLFIVTLGVGYLVWGAISRSRGRAPTQKILGMQTWKPQTRANATWGEQFPRESSCIMCITPLIGWIIAIVSFFMFLASREHRALHDQVGGAIVLHDPNRVLQPTAPVGTARRRPGLAQRQRPTVAGRAGAIGVMSSLSIVPG